MNMDNKILDTGVIARTENKTSWPAPYYAKVLETIENEHLRIGIFERATANKEGIYLPQYSDKDHLIGEYTRNSRELMRTFHPFELRGKWYALYSKDSRYTDLMELPSCKVIGTECRDEEFFCFHPVDYWVPPLAYVEDRHQTTCPRHGILEHYRERGKNCTCNIMHRPDCPSPSPRFQARSCICNEEWNIFKKECAVWHCPDRIHGFIAGYVKAVDSGFMIEYLDLSKADEGIVVRDTRFGFVELPNELPLSKAVHLNVNYGKCDKITLAVLNSFSMITGQNLQERNYEHDSDGN